MKSVLLIFATSIGLTTAALAQCDKNLLLTSSKTEYCDAAGNVERTVDEASTISITGKEIVITAGPENHIMRGQIKSSTCEWKVPFKEGKTVIKTDMERNGGDSKAVTITIEGKDGKVMLIAKVDDDPNRIIRVPLDSFKEK